MKFSIKDFFSRCDKIRSLLQIWSNLLKKSLMENLIFVCSDVYLRQTLFKQIRPHKHRPLALHEKIGTKFWQASDSAVSSRTTKTWN